MLAEVLVKENRYTPQIAKGISETQAIAINRRMRVILLAALISETTFIPINFERIYPITCVVIKMIL